MRSIAGFLKDRDDAIKMVRNGIEVDFCTRRAAFQDDLQKYAEQVSKFKKLGNIKQVPTRTRGGRDAARGNRKRRHAP